MDKLVTKIANANIRLQVTQDNNRLRDVLAGKMTKARHVRTALQVSSDQFFNELVKPL